MSQTQKDLINLIMGWGTKVIFGISSFLLVSFAYELKTDVKDMKIEVKSVQLDQREIKEKVRRIERIADKLEDGGITNKSN